MLDRLKFVPWADLIHAYGEASGVPSLLRQLLSPDGEERAEAIRDLSMTICHQGTVYSATAAAVPFLYEILAAPEVPDKSEIARLLASIAIGTGYYSRSGALFADFEPVWREILAKEGKTLEAERERENVEIAAVRRAVSASLGLLMPYLRHEDRSLRRLVAIALGNFPEHAEKSLEALQSALAAETTRSAASAHMRRSIERLSKHGP
jgi:hypothetical protein